MYVYVWAVTSKAEVKPQVKLCMNLRCQRASSVRCSQTKTRGLTTPRSSKSPFADSADVIDSEIEVNQRWTLRKHSCKPLCLGLLVDKDDLINYQLLII